MKLDLVTTLLLGTLAGSLAVSAQTPAPRAGTAPPPAMAAPAPVAAAPASARPPAVATRTVMSDADARNCLEFPTNTEIIKCAEKYLQRRPRA